jgi:hypothetical protein
LIERDQQPGSSVAVESLDPSDGTSLASATCVVSAGLALCSVPAGLVSDEVAEPLSVAPGEVAHVPAAVPLSSGEVGTVVVSGAVSVGELGTVVVSGGALVGSVGTVVVPDGLPVGDGESEGDGL